MTRVERLQPQFDEVVDADTELRQVATGMAFTEGPVWHPSQQCVLFTDIPNNNIMRWSEAEGLSTHVQNSHFAIGLYLDAEERLLACEHSTKRVTRYETDGNLTTLASHHGEAILNSTNDVCVRSDGSIFFTDPPFGVRLEGDQLAGYQVGSEYGACYVFKVSDDPTSPQVVTDAIYRPNGLCFSLDEKTLFVSDSSERYHQVYALDMQADDTATNPRVFATLPSGVPDGLRMDTDGRLYVAGPDGVYVYDADGHHLGKLLVPEMVTNFCFGGEGRQTLFITAMSSLYAIDLKTTGVQRP
jgi:gluconolactonase